jgi:hypothetical protein
MGDLLSGMNKEIQMSKRVRKTEDEFRIMCDYGYGDGLEEVCCASTREEGKMNLKDYRENDPRNSYTMVKKRVKIAPAVV